MRLDSVDPRTASRAEVEQLATLVMGSRLVALRWMRERSMGLDGKVPRTLMRSRAGREQIASLLLRTLYGVYN